MGEKLTVFRYAVPHSAVSSNGKVSVILKGLLWKLQKHYSNFSFPPAIMMAPLISALLAFFVYLEEDTTDENNNKGGKIRRNNPIIFDVAKLNIIPEKNEIIIDSIIGYDNRNQLKSVISKSKASMLLYLDLSRHEKYSL